MKYNTSAAQPQCEVEALPHVCIVCTFVPSCLCLFLLATMPPCGTLHLSLQGIPLRLGMASDDDDGPGFGDAHDARQPRFGCPEITPLPMAHGFA